MEAARVARPDDLGELTALAELAHAERRLERGGPEWSDRSDPLKRTQDGLQSLLDSPDSCVVAGTFDGSVVGLGRCHVIQTRSGGRVGEVEELYVLPDARGVGVGEAMMNQLLAWCEQHDCEAIESVALPGNRAAKNFFERFGLVARAIVVRRSLRP